MKCTWDGVGVAPCTLFALGTLIRWPYPLPNGTKTNPALLSDGSVGYMDYTPIEVGPRIKVPHPRTKVPHPSTKVPQVRLMPKNEIIAECEDPRFFQFDGHTLMLCNRMVGSKTCMFAKNLTSGAMTRLKRTSTSPEQFALYNGWEKNWAFFEADRVLYVLHSVSPLTVMQCDFSSGDCTVVHNSPVTEKIRHPQLDEAFDSSKSRLSTPLVPYGKNKLLGMGHIRTQNSVYLHFLYTLHTKDFRVGRVTPLFRLPMRGRIQYASSVAWRDSKSLLVSFGIDDIAYGFAILRKQDVDFLLRNYSVPDCNISVYGAARRRSCGYSHAPVCRAVCPLQCTRYPYLC